ncbi:hypothetical protein HDU86_000492 [Geranomyces michiganensis]|nr:hypothetical protein HDU86_000492 [Geranomyces michiganensis]
MSTAPPAAAAAPPANSSTTPRQLGVLRDGNFPMSLRRSSAPGYSASASSRPTATGSASSSASSASASASLALLTSWKRRSDGDAHLRRSFATHTPEASLEFLDHLQSLIVARPSSSMSTRRRGPPMIKRPRRSTSTSRLTTLSALHSSPPAPPANHHARSESAQFVDSWLKTLDATAAAAAPAPAAGAGEKNTGVLGMLDSRIAELTMEIENLRAKPLAGSTRAPPPPSAQPTPLPQQQQQQRQHQQERNRCGQPPVGTAGIANPFQSLVDHLDTLSLASSRGTPLPLPPPTPPPSAPPSPPQPSKHSAAV